MRKEYNISNIIVLLMLVIFVSISSSFTSGNVNLVTSLSILLLLYQLFVLFFLKYSFFSFHTLFILLSFLFNFSFFWLISLGKSEFIFFPNWMYRQIPEKCESAFFALMCIQAVFTGLMWRKRSSIKKGFVEKREITPRTCFRIGLVMFFLGLPFKLYFDYLNILNSVQNGGYGGFGGVSGLADDFQHFAVAGVITMIASGHKSKGFNLLTIAFVLAYFFFVMTASGDRRYYVTAIIGILMAYVGTSNNFGEKKKAEKSKKKLLQYGLLFVLSVFLLNLLAIIRNVRSTSLGSEMFAQNPIAQLFSLDGIWETLGEFGITINALVLARQVVPSAIPYQFGASYLYAILFILPIGAFVSIPNASIGHAITAYVDIPVGSSYILDLYANFGLLSFLPAIILGIVLSRIVSSNLDLSPKRLALNCSFSYILINYVRASSIEVLRPIVYIAIMFVIIEWFVQTRRVR